MNFNFRPTTTAGTTPVTWTFSPMMQTTNNNVQQNIPTTMPNPFGGVAAAQTATVPNPFGGVAAAPTNTVPNPFGGVTRPQATVPNPFGGVGAAPTNTVPNPFGGVTRPQATVPNPFGGVAAAQTATVTNPFGGVAAAPTNTVPNPFGGVAAAPTATVPNPFAGPAPTIQSPFGPAFRTNPVTTPSQTVPTNTGGSVVVNRFTIPQTIHPNPAVTTQTMQPATIGNPPFNTWSIHPAVSASASNPSSITTLPAPGTETKQMTVQVPTSTHVPKTLLNTIMPNPSPVNNQQAVPLATNNDSTQMASNTVQQRLLEAYLIDPFCRQGVKESTNLEIKQPLKDVPVTTMSISSTPTNVLTTSTSEIAPIPLILPSQSNSRKALSSHPILDLKLNLKPVLAATEAREKSDPKNSDGKSSISSPFTQQEESILLTHQKGSRLRLPTDFHQSSSNIRPVLSLYPERSLDELDMLAKKIETANISIPTTSSSPSTMTTEQRTDIEPQPPTNTVTIDVQSVELPILTRDRYYIKPTMAELKSLCNKQGECIVHQVTIGHEEYGSVTFYGWINLSGMNLDEIVKIEHHEVTVYADDEKKPPEGQGLNLPARITLFGVYPRDRATHEEITDIERIQAMKYDQYLREITQKFDGEFVDYDAKDGSWVFKVKHFTRYGL